MEEFELKAKLHGREFKKSMKPLNITKEKRDEYDTQAAKLLQRMKDKYEDGKRSRTTD